MSDPKADRIGVYLAGFLEEFLFDELSQDYLKKVEMQEILSGIPVPVRKTAMRELTNLKIAQNMAFVMGCDINFTYRDNYLAYIFRSFGKDFVGPWLQEGVDRAAEGKFLAACVHFRAALLMAPDNTDALYCYGRACRDAYEHAEDPDAEFVGRFKAESLEAFERLTINKPEFANGFYFLGYGYLNLGLYVKARLTFQEFLRLVEEEGVPLDQELDAMRKEVEEWVTKLEEPVKIEAGYNDILAGRCEEGIAILEPYREDARFNGWWPLWYYLGIAYGILEAQDQAKEAFLQVLQLSPSNLDAMEELVKLYQAEGDQEKQDKYQKKIDLIRSQMEQA